MIFGLVFISYELVNMGPGDNIAYKLGAAATKKNQELCFFLQSIKNNQFFYFLVLSTVY